MSRAGKNSKALPRAPSGAKAETPTPAPTAPEEPTKVAIWPEFNENELASEKWDGGGKGKDKKGTPFLDPDGPVVLPLSFADVVASWKRPVDFITDNTPVVVSAETTQEENIDLVSPNSHIITSEMIRWIICQVTALWKLPSALPGWKTDQGPCWKPWDHIYPRQKGQTLPYYNPGGKYCVKLFWMGLWRKVIIDDSLPLDTNGKLLLPVSRPNELWLPLLTKAILKVAALDCHSDLSPTTEFGDVSIIHLLTGWLSEPIPIRSGHKDPMWKLIKSHLPRWTPPLDTDNESQTPSSDPAPIPTAKDKKQVKGPDAAKTSGGGGEPLPFKRENNAVLVFAAYTSISSNPRLSSSDEQVHAATCQREAGLLPEMAHVVLVTQTRKESLEQLRPPDPDALLPKFAYLGFKSRRQRLLEAEDIARKLASIDAQLVEISSPFIDQSTTNGSSKTKWMKFDQFIKCFTTLYVFHRPSGYEFKQAIHDVRNLVQSSGGLKKDKGQSTTNLAGSGNYSIHPRASPVGPNGTLSNLLCVDSLKPIEIILNFSVIPRWPYGGNSNKKVVDVGRPESAQAEPNPTGTEIETASEDAKPGLVIVEEYMWDTLVTGQPLLKIKTTGTKAAALCMPPGRHLVRFNTSAPIAYHLEFWSLAKFSYAEEDEVLNELTKESLRYRAHALNVLGTLATVVDMFDDVDAWREAFYSQGLGHRGRDLTAYHCRLLYASLLHTLKTCLGDALTKDLALSWKAFAQEGLRLFLQGMEKDSPKGVTDFDKLNFNDLNDFFRQKEPPQIPENWIDREASDVEISASVKIQATFRAYWQRKLWKTVTQGSPEHEKARDLLASSLEVIKANVELVAMTLFHTMFKMDPQLLNKFPFKDDEWSRAVFEDHERQYKEQPAKSWFIMFRETFFVRNHGLLIVPHVYSSIPVCSLHVFNNDTLEETRRVFDRVMPQVYTKNKRGYTFVVEGRTLDEAIPAGKCRLRLIGTEEKLLRLKTKKTPTTSQFNTDEVKEYYLPRKDYVFFRKRIKVKEDVQVSFEITTSKPKAIVKLEILDTYDDVEKVIACRRGMGHAVIPAFAFLRDGERNEADSDWDVNDDDDDVESIVSRRASPTMTSRMARSRAGGSRAGSRVGSRRASVLSFIPESDENRSSRRSRAPSVDEGTAPEVTTKESEDARPPTEAGEEPRDDDEDDEDEDDLFGPSTNTHEIVQPTNHKYVLQGTVLRDSWDVKESAVAFVKLQRAGQMRQKAKISQTHGHDKEKDAPRAPTAAERATSAASKRGKSKVWSKLAGSKAASATGKRDIEPNVAHWTLRIVTEDEQKNWIHVAKDTEKEDAINAMKQAWEAAEPGRAAKAKMTREKFLKERDPTFEFAKIDEKTSPSDDTKSVASSEDGGASASSSVIRLQRSSTHLDPAAIAATTSSRRVSTSDVTDFFSRRPLRQHDYSRFTRKATADDVAVMLDDEEIKRRHSKVRDDLERYKAIRDCVLEARERDRVARNQAKIIQLETAQRMQAAVDEARSRITALRESYRKKCQAEAAVPDSTPATPVPVAEEKGKRGKSPAKSASKKGRK